MAEPDAGIVERFIDAACVPMDAAHASGTLEAADAILASHPELARASIHVAAALGDDAGVARWLERDAGNATRAGGPRGWDPLTTLCFSRYLRLDPARSAAFVRAGELLLTHGASANTGFRGPPFESVLYGAAGVAHHAKLTRLLLAHGADPNDGEVVYHAPEGFDNAALRVLVSSGRVGPDGLTTMLVRKLDWTDHDGVAWLLANGADPNRLSHWGERALHHALGRDNPTRFLELLLDGGADPRLDAKDGRSAFAVAARTGRADALRLFERRGSVAELTGDDALLGACVRGDESGARGLVSADPAIVARLQAEEPGLLADVAGSGHTAAVRLMLDLGFDVALPTRHPGARGDTALHLAIWRSRHDTVELLVDRGAPLEARNRAGDTPLSHAVRALVEWSEWTPHGSTGMVATLLRAGARADAVRLFPCGVPEADDMLR